MVAINVFPPMSYHRVLPPPPALAKQNPSTWSIEPDSLLQHKIMTKENTNISSRRSESLTLSQKSPSPAEEREPTSPSDEPLNNFVDPPKHRLRSSSRTSNEESHHSDQRLASISWEDETPSQICLCQPDPKIPRPRNGMYVHFLYALYTWKLDWLEVSPCVSQERPGIH